MSYEYKEDIQTAMGEHINHLNILEDALEELDEVYAKAKVFDKYHATISSHLHLNSEPEFSSPPTEVLSDIIDIHNEYESGDSE